MKPIKYVSIAVLLVQSISINAYTGETDLSLQGYIQLLLKNNKDLEISKLSFYRDEKMLELQRENFKPQLSMNSAPLYGYNNSKTISPEGKETNVFTHSVNLGSEINIDLPTGGSLLFSLADTLSCSGMGEKYLFSNSPVVTAKLDQPIFVNGGLLNTESYASRYKKLSVDERLNALGTLVDTNTYIFTMAKLFVDTVVQNKRLDILKRKLALYKKKQELLEIMMKQGRRSSIDYWEQDLKVKDLEKTAFDQRFLLSTAMKKIAVSIGFKREIKNLILNDVLPTIDLPEALQVGKNTEVAISSLNLLKKRFEMKEEMSNYATMLGVEFSLKPQYPVDSSGSNNFKDSVSNLWDKNSWIEFYGSISVTVPVGEYWQRKLKKESLEYGIKIEELALESKKLNTKRSLDELKEKMAYLLTRDKFLKEQQNYFKEREMEAESLLEIKRIIPADLKEAELNLSSAKVDVYENNAAIFLTLIEMHKLVGDDLSKLF